ncbi:MAG: serine/threonine protein kinase [Lentisphaerales bacterium]|nr:serine/threonine protein kinase [Lentisphaerales bacterium]
MKNNPKRILDQDQMEYRGSDFYDFDDEVDLLEFSPLYRELIDISEVYSDINKIDAGGMKSIFKVFDKKTGRYLAMAKLHEDTPEEFYEPFIREARLTAALEHPNIIKVHEIGVDEKAAPFFTMDLKIGDSLSDILAKLDKGEVGYSEQYNLRSLLVIFLKVCDAMSYAHSREILHLDLKPENIQVGKFGEVLVCDWGLAKIIGQDEQDEELLLNPDLLNNVTLHGVIKGTPGYISPEQVEGVKHKSKTMDIYALGALLYCLLTQKRPLNGSSNEILEKTKKGEIVPPIERCEEIHIPESLNAVVLKAMSLEPNSRYQSIHDLATDVIHYLDGYSTEAENAGVLKELKLFYQRNKRLCQVSILFFTLLVISTLVFIGYLNKSREGEALARKAAEANEHAAEVARLEAELNFKRYKKEEDLTNLSLISNSGRIIHDLRRGFYKKVLTDPQKEINEAIDTLDRIGEVSKSIGYYNFICRLYFIIQEFDLAYEALKKGSPPDEHAHAYLFKALEAILGEKKREDGTYPPEAIGKMVSYLEGHFKDQVILLGFLDYQKRKNIDEHAQVIKYVLANVNHNWQMDEFTFNPENNSLKIAGNCPNFSSILSVSQENVNILKTLNVETLDIRGVNWFQTKSLKGLELKELDIRGLHLNSPDNQVIGPDVTETIYLTKKNIHPELLMKIESLITVREKKSGF